LSTKYCDILLVMQNSPYKLTSLDTVFHSIQMWPHIYNSNVLIAVSKISNYKTVVKIQSSNQPLNYHKELNTHKININIIYNHSRTFVLRLIQRKENSEAKVYHNAYHTIHIHNIHNIHNAYRQDAWPDLELCCRGMLQKHFLLLSGVNLKQPWNHRHYFKLSA